MGTGLGIRSSADGQVARTARVMDSGRVAWSVVGKQQERGGADGDGPPGLNLGTRAAQRLDTRSIAESLRSPWKDGATFNDSWNHVGVPILRSTAPVTVRSHFRPSRHPKVNLLVCAIGALLIAVPIAALETAQTIFRQSRRFVALRSFISISAVV